MQPHRRVGLDIGVRSDTRLLAVARVLTADQASAGHGAYRLEHAVLLVAQRVHTAADGRVHREMRNDLQQMVLDDVANRAHLFVELAAAFHAQRFGHRNGHASDVVAVPDGLEERVREAKVQKILHRLLAEVVIDAKHGRLGEHAVQHAIQVRCRFQIATEGLLDHDARAVGDAGGVQSQDHRFEQAWRNGQVVKRTLALAERLLHALEGGGVAVVAVDVAKVLEQPALALRILGITETRQRIGYAFAKRLFVHAASGDRDDRQVDAPFQQRLNRWENLAVREIARSTEQHQGVRGFMGCAHGCFSTWPPNP